MNARLIVVAAIAVTVGLGLSACGSGDQITEAAAGAAAEQLTPQVQSALESAGFTNVKVNSETDTDDTTGKTYAVLSANVTIPQLNPGCALNYEARVTQPGTIYFDEVITPEKPDGVEVTDAAARNSLSPVNAFNYVFKKHPTCLIPNAVAPTK